MNKNIFLIVLMFSFSMISMKNSDWKPSRRSPIKGYINIIVESNINKLSFSYPIREMIISGETTNNSDESGTVNIVIPVKEFRCTNKKAYRDFLDLLKEDEFPNMIIEIPKKEMISLQNNKSVTIPDVLINIAGVSRHYQIDFRAEEEKEGRDIQRGTIKVWLTDLNIEPPVKYLGVIKIKDEVIVNFGINIQEKEI